MAVGVLAGNSYLEFLLTVHTGPSIFLFKKNKKKIQYGPYGTSMHVLCSVMSCSQDFERRFHLNVKGSRFQAYYDKVNWPLDMSP